MEKITTNPEEMLNDICGFVRYTCEKQPRVIQMNETMRKMLRFPESAPGEISYRELYMENIFLMIPMEERRRFSHFLNRVYSSGCPVSGEMALVRADGTRMFILGWVTKCVNADGAEEFRSVCMDVTEHHREKQSQETQRYLAAISCVYDKIFEFNFRANTVKCLHSQDRSLFKQFENVAVQMEDALDNWILTLIHSEDIGAVKAFFRGFLSKNDLRTETDPPQVTYRARSSSGEYRHYSGVLIRIDEYVSYFCCRRTVDLQGLKSENDQLRSLIRNMSDGIAAFELTQEGLVKPLYASENVCEFFGYTQEEWLSIMEHPVPLDNFVAYSESSYDDFETLFRNGEAEFTYFDYATERKRQIRAVCSRREQGGTGSSFVMLYTVENSAGETRKSLPENRAVTIRTFGYFDIFVGDRPIPFKNKKSKELLALLIDRRGGYVSAEEVIGFL